MEKCFSYVHILFKSDPHTFDIRQALGILQDPVGIK